MNQAIEDYMGRLPGAAEEVLAEMESRAAEIDFPIVGPLVGRLLYQLTRLGKARRILELGSGFGYSAYWFGKGLVESGELILTDFSAEKLELAKDYLRRAGITAAIQYHAGDALETLDRVDGEFDIIYNDVDKHLYPEIFRKSAPRLRDGGLLLSDNVLWHGRVVDPDDKNPNLHGVLEYNRLIFDHPEFYSSIVPLRDGLSVSLKNP